MWPVRRVFFIKRVCTRRTKLFPRMQKYSALEWSLGCKICLFFYIENPYRKWRKIIFKRMSILYYYPLELLFFFFFLLYSFFFFSFTSDRHSLTFPANVATTFTNEEERFISLSATWPIVNIAELSCADHDPRCHSSGRKECLDRFWEMYICPNYCGLCSKSTIKRKYYRFYVFKHF